MKIKLKYSYLLITFIFFIFISFISSNVLAIEYHDNFSHYTSDSYSPNYLLFLKSDSATSDNGYRDFYQVSEYSYLDYNAEYNLIRTHIDSSSYEQNSYVLSQTLLEFNETNNENLWSYKSGNFSSFYSFDTLDNWTITNSTNAYVSKQEYVRSSYPGL